MAKLESMESLVIMGWPAPQDFRDSVLLEEPPSLKACAALTTASAASLRASEAVSLKVAEIDCGLIVIKMHHRPPAPAGYAEN